MHERHVGVGMLRRLRVVGMHAVHLLSNSVQPARTTANAATVVTIIASTLLPCPGRPGRGRPGVMEDGGMLPLSQAPPNVPSPRGRSDAEAATD